MLARRPLFVLCLLIQTACSIGDAISERTSNVPDDNHQPIAQSGDRTSVPAQGTSNTATHPLHTSTPISAPSPSMPANVVIEGDVLQQWASQTLVLPVNFRETHDRSSPLRGPIGVNGQRAYTGEPSSYEGFNILKYHGRPVSVTAPPIGGERDPRRPLVSDILRSGDVRRPIGAWEIYDWNNPNAPVNQGHGWPGTLVAFGVSHGEVIYAPTHGGRLVNAGALWSGQEGYSVLYADADQHVICLSGAWGDVVNVGYVIYIVGVAIDQSILDAYKNHSTASRTDLISVLKGERLGKAVTDKVWVALRDTGTFQDLRDAQWYSLD